MDKETKNKISHRYRAIEKLMEYFEPKIEIEKKDTEKAKNGNDHVAEESRIEKERVSEKPSI